MPFPQGYNPKKFTRDPANRSGHIYYPDTDEAFAVDDATYQKVIAANPELLADPDASDDALKVAAQSAELDLLRAELVSTQDQLREAQGNQAAAEGAAKSAQDELAVTQAQLDAARAEAEQLRQQSAEQAQEIESLRASLPTEPSNAGN